MQRIKDLSKHPLVSGSFVLVVGGMFVNAINYLYHLIFGRILGPVGYGELASLYSILYISSIVPVSASVAIVKFVSSAKTDTERASFYYAVKGLVTKISLVLAGALIISSPFIAQFLKIENFLEVAIIGPIVFLSLITLVNQSARQGVLDFIGFIVPYFVSSLGKLVFGLMLIYLGWSVFGAMVGILIASIPAYFLSLGGVNKVTKGLKIKQYKLSSFLKYSFPVLVQALAFTSFFTSDIILVKHFFPAYDAGLYAALSILGKVVFFAASPVSSVMFPMISARIAKGERYTKIFLASLFMAFSLSFAIVAFYKLFPQIAIGILYGEKYLGIKEALPWMGLFIAFYTLSHLLTNFFLSIGQTKVAYLALFVAAVQAIALWYFHPSLLIVVQISLGFMALLFLALSSVLIYNFAYARNKA